MRISGSSYRDFYPQKSFDFDFTVSDYTSRNFEVGISGDSYLAFGFKSGLIRDPLQNIVGTFNGEDISVSLNYRTGIYNYSLNSIPVVRNVFSGVSGVSGATNVTQSAIVAKILDGPASIGLESYVYGDTVPTLAFSNFYSTTGTNGTSGRVTNQGAYKVKIFSGSSPNMTGGWVFPSVLLPFVPTGFYSLAASGLDRGTIVSLNLETSFGNQNYSLRVQGITDSGSATNDLSGTIFGKNSFVEIWPYSGSVLPGLSWESLYQIDYNVGTGNSLNFAFDYAAGRTGNVALTWTFNKDVPFSGTLPVISGLASGYLYNSYYSFVSTSWALDAHNTGDVTFGALGTLTGYFTGLRPTGNAVVSLLSSEISPYIAVAEDAVNAGYLVDYGGYFGTFTGVGSSTRDYTRQSDYKGVSVETFNPLSFTGFTWSGNTGRYVFEYSFVNYLKSGLLTTTYPILYGVCPTGTFLNLSPYRGVAFGALTSKEDPYAIVDYPVVLTGDTTVGGKRAYALLHESYPTLLYKNIPQINYNGEYNFSAGTLVSGTFIMENAFYRKGGGQFSRDTDTTFEGKDLGNSYIQDSLDVYRNLSPILNVTGTTTNLAVGFNSLELVLDTNRNYDWNGNNFLALKPSTPINYPPFYSDGVPVIAISFDKEEFLYAQNYTISKTKDLNLAPPSVDGTQYFTDNVTIFTLSDAYFATLVPTKVYFQRFKSRVISAPSVACFFSIPFVPNLTLNQNTFEPAFFCFSAYVTRSNSAEIAERGQFLQIYTSDGLDLTNEYQNFDLHEDQLTNPAANITVCALGAKNALFTERNITPVSIEVVDSNWFRISFAFRVLTDKKIAFVRVGFVNDCASARGETFSDSASLNFANIQLEKLPAQTFPIGHTILPTSFANSQTSKFHVSNQNMTVSAAFDFFLCKILDIDGVFQNNYTSFVGDQTIPITDVSKTRIKNFLTAKLSSSTTLNSKIFAKQRNDRSFMKMFVKGSGVSFDIADGLSLFGATDTMDYYENDATHGSAVTDILNAVKNYNPSYSSEHYLDTDVATEAIPVFYALPDQPFGYSVQKMSDLELTYTLFSGKLKNSRKAYILAGYGRNYFSSGFFFETEDFFDIRNAAIPIADSRTTVFPNSRELLNQKAILSIPCTNLLSTTGVMTRIIVPTGTQSYTVPINKTGYLTSAYCTGTQSSWLSMTGIYYNATGKISDIWNFALLDSIGDLTPDLIPTGTITLNTSGYVKSGIGITDDTYRSLWLRTRFTPKFETFGVQDEGVVTMTVTSGITGWSSVSLTLP